MANTLRGKMNADDSSEEGHGPTILNRARVIGRVKQALQDIVERFEW